MSIDPRYLIARLSEWPEWRPGTEAHTEVIEFLKAEITGITGRDPIEEGFFALSSPWAAIFLCLFLCAGLLFYGTQNPLLVIVLGWLLFFLFVAIRSGFGFSLKRLGSQMLSETISLDIKGGKRLILVTASVAPDPCSVYGRPNTPITRALGGYLEFACWFLTIIAVSLSFIAPAALAFAWIFFGLSAVLVLVRYYDLMTLGVSPAASGLAAACCAIALTDRLKAKKLLDTEIRLILTGGVADANEGAEIYLAHHGEDFDYRDVILIGFDNIGGAPTAALSGVGQLFEKSLINPLLKAAASRSKSAEIPLNLRTYGGEVCPFTPFLKKAKSSLLLMGLDANGERAPAGHMANRVQMLKPDRLLQAVDIAEGALETHLGLASYDKEDENAV